MKAIRHLVLALFLGAIAADAYPAEFLKAPRPAPRPDAVDRTELPARPTGISGWALMDLSTGEIVDAEFADHPFAPASVAKLPTAAFALDALGPDYQFRTRVLTTAPLKDGLIAGDIYLQGGGNPELDTDRLFSLAERLSELGVKSVEGRFLVDGSALPQLPAIDESQAEDSSYNPSISGLNLNFNRVHVKWDARRGREELSVVAEATRRSPQVEGVQVALAEAPDAPVFSLREEGGREIWSMAKWAFKGRAARWLPVKRPEPYAGEVFRTLAAELGISVAHPEIGEVPITATVLAEHASRPLARILREMMRYSTNLTAEVVGISATRASGIDAVTLSDSARVMNTWAAAIAGFPVDDPGFRFVNHSGLTTESRVTPRRMVELLAALSRRESVEPVRTGSIDAPIALYMRPYNVAAKSVELDYEKLDVRAKTGTMSYIRGLAGYFSTPSDRRFAFAIFANDLDRRSGGAERVNRSWMARAKNFERALIRKWVVEFDRAS